VEGLKDQVVEHLPSKHEALNLKHRTPPHQKEQKIFLVISILQCFTFHILFFRKKILNDLNKIREKTKKQKLWPGTCNSSTQEAEAGGSQIEASLIVKPCLKQTNKYIYMK
jgi:hypothetical protein